MKISLRLIPVLLALAFATTGFSGDNQAKEQKPADKKAVECTCGDACKNSANCCCKAKAKDCKEDGKAKDCEKK